MGSPWQYLGHFRRQETGPFASSQAIHTPHLPSFNCVAIKASQRHLPPCAVQCPGSAELMQAYHLFADHDGASVLKFPFLAPFFVQCVKYNIQYISFLLFSRTVMTKSITLGEEGVQGWVWMWAAFVTFLCKSEPQDIMNRMTSAPMCVIRQEPPSCIQNTSDTTLAIECNSATVSLPLLHFSFSTDDPIVIMFCCICDYVQSNRFALWKKGFSEVLFYWPDYHCMYYHRVRMAVNYQRRLKLGLTTDHEH